MKYLLKETDIDSADWRRVILSADKILVKNFYKKIDLGLPSGTLWADRNIGANDIYDSGKLFQWGDTTPYDVPQYNTSGVINEGQKMFKWGDYKWSQNGSSTMTKYNKTDKKTKLDDADDAANVLMGSIWKMPTEAQITELFKSTNMELYAKITDDAEPLKVANGQYNTATNMIDWNYISGYSKNNVAGKIAYVKLISKTNSNSLIIPSSPRAYNGNVLKAGNGGFFWLSSVYTTDITRGLFGFFLEEHFDYSILDRFGGMSIRGVVG